MTDQARELLAELVAAWDRPLGKNARGDEPRLVNGKRGKVRYDRTIGPIVSKARIFLARAEASAP
jgi:hypothetical protein